MSSLVGEGRRGAQGLCSGQCCRLRSSPMNYRGVNSRKNGVWVREQTVSCHSGQHFEDARPLAWEYSGTSVTRTRISAFLHRVCDLEDGQQEQKDHFEALSHPMLFCIF